MIATDTPIQYIKDIPEDVYNQLPNFVYNTWKKQFTQLIKYTDKLYNNKIELPIDKNEILSKRFHSFICYIINDETDVLNLKYYIFFRIGLPRFKNKLNVYFKNYGIMFDYDLFRDKDKLLSDTEKGLSEILNNKVSIAAAPRNITFTATVILKTKSDIIIM